LGSDDPNSIAAGDFDGDGLVGLVAPSSNAAAVLPGRCSM
jgi:hypothetical protein